MMVIMMLNMILVMVTAMMWTESGGGHQRRGMRVIQLLLHHYKRSPLEFCSIFSTALIGTPYWETPETLTPPLGTIGAQGPLAPII